MNRQLNRFAIPGLRWTLGVILLLESAHFALSRSAVALPRWIPPVLGGTEAIAALLFLVPAASPAGGYLLLAIFAIAAALHILQGEFHVGSLMIYGMAVIVCLAHPSKEATETPHDR